MIAVLALVACRGVAAPALPESPTDHAARLPLIVAIHGLGDRPENLLALVDRCGLPARVVALRGPEPYHDGFSWFGVAFGPDGASVDAAQVAAAADSVASQITELVRERDVVGKPILTGFSQGGILSYAVAVRHPDAIGLAVPMSGGLPPSLTPSGPPPPGAPSIRAVHGRDDRVLPLAEAVATDAALRAAGWDAELLPFDGVGHGVPAPVHRAVCERLAAGVAAAR